MFFSVFVEKPFLTSSKLKKKYKNFVNFVFLLAEKKTRFLFGCLHRVVDLNELIPIYFLLDKVLNTIVGKNIKNKWIGRDSYHLSKKIKFVYFQHQLEQLYFYSHI